jgi:hypothetical protein
MQRELVFTKEEWEAAMPGVVAGMKSFLSAYRTPIFKDCGDHGEGWGSGSYIGLGERRFVVTNEHVATVRYQNQSLAHQLLNDDDLYRIVGNHADHPLPLDLALLPVSDQAWAAERHGSRAIDIDQIALAHDPVPGELLTFTGFSGEATDFHFNTLHTEGTCYTAREADLLDDPRFDRRYHFGIDYRPDLAIRVDGSRGLPMPPGLSGSTVWNTRFVAAKMARMAWSPEMRCGMGVAFLGGPSRRHTLGISSQLPAGCRPCGSVSNSKSGCLHTCCATPPATRWRMLVRIPGQTHDHPPLLHKRRVPRRVPA